jgi:hypothetical protein
MSRSPAMANTRAPSLTTGATQRGLPLLWSYLTTWKRSAVNAPTSCTPTFGAQDLPGLPGHIQVDGRQQSISKRLTLVVAYLEGRGRQSGPTGVMAGPD